MRRDKLIKEYTTRGGTHVTIFQEMTDKEEPPFPDHVEDDMQVHIANEDADKERREVFTDNKEDAKRLWFHSNNISYTFIPPAKPIIVRPDLVWDSVKKNREALSETQKEVNAGFEEFAKKHNVVATIVYILVAIQACPWVWPYLIMLKDVVKSYM